MKPILVMTKRISTNFSKDLTISKNIDSFESSTELENVFNKSFLGCCICCKVWTFITALYAYVCIFYTVSEF